MTYCRNANVQITTQQSHQELCPQNPLKTITKMPANEETAAGDNAATVAAAGTQSENDASNAGNGDVNGHGPPQGEGGSGGGANGLTEIAEQGQQGAQGQGESGERAAKSARIE